MLPVRQQKEKILALIKEGKGCKIIKETNSQPIFLKPGSLKIASGSSFKGTDHQTNIEVQIFFTEICYPVEEWSPY